MDLKNINKYFNFILSNYDTTKLISSENKDIQEFIINISKLSNNYTVKSLINNIENINNYTKIDYISGPGEITYLTKNNKKIYILGEQNHHDIIGCLKYNNITNSIDITQFLTNLLQTSPVFIDFFIELPPMLNLYPNTDEIINDISSNLNNIYLAFEQFIKKTEIFPMYNARIHLIDSRNIISNKNYENTLYRNMIRDLNNLIDSRINFKQFRKNNKKIIKTFSNIKSIKELLQLLRNEVYNDTFLKIKIKKTNIKYKPIVNFFINRLEKLPIDNSLEIELNQQKFISFVNWFSLAKQKSSWSYKTNLPLIYSIITNITTVFMDIYTVSRMFKTFIVKPDENAPIYANNIIYYAGNFHSNAIKDFLIKYKFNILFKNSIDNTINCLDIRHMKQPLFL